MQDSIRFGGKNSNSIILKNDIFTKPNVSLGL